MTGIFQVIYSTQATDGIIHWYCASVDVYGGQRLTSYSLVSFKEAKLKLTELVKEWPRQPDYISIEREKIDG